MDVFRIELNHTYNRGPLDYFQNKVRCAHVRLENHYGRWQQSWISVVAYLALVASVSIYDIILTVLYAPYLKYAEQNPLGRWMMDLDRLANGATPDLTLFLTMKSLGTIVVLSAMYGLILWRSRLGHPVALGVSCFQFWLAAYLTFGTSTN